MMSLVIFPVLVTENALAELAIYLLIDSPPDYRKRSPLHMTSGMRANETLPKVLPLEYAVVVFMLHQLYPAEWLLM